MTARPPKKRRAALVVCLYVAGESPNSLMPFAALLRKQVLNAPRRHCLPAPDEN